MLLTLIPVTPLKLTVPKVSALYLQQSFLFQFYSFFFVGFRLEIEVEKLFVDMTRILAVAMHWEERAKYILAHEAALCDFEDAIRY